MDYIKKTICLEGARTRTQGLMPYYEVGAAYPQHVSGDSAYSCFSVSELGLTVASGNNGNWGQFVANPCFLAVCGKTYDTMLQNYYSLLNMVRNGIKLRKVYTKEGETIYVESMESIEFNKVSKCFDDVVEPDSIYEYAAYDSGDFSSSEINSQTGTPQKVYRYDGSYIDAQYVVLVSDFHKFSGMSCYLSGITVPNTLSADTIVEDAHSMWSAYCSTVDACIGKINIPASIYNNHIKVPKSMPCADVNEYITWLNENKGLTGNCCNAKLWDDMGGEDMLDFLEASAETKCEDYRKAVNELEYSVPYIEMPVLLIQNFTGVGVLTNIDGVEYGKEDRPHKMGTIGEGPCIEEIAMESKRTAYPTTEDYENAPELYDRKPIEVESLLKTLRSKKKYTDDHDNVLPGLFKSYQDFPGGIFVKFTKGNNGWTSAATTDTVVNGDGMSSQEAVNTNYYRSVTTVSAAKRVAEVYDQEPKESDSPVQSGSVFYFKVKYDNSESTPMTLPYIVGNVTNLYYDEVNDRFRGDIIVSSSITSSITSYHLSSITSYHFIVTYAIGGVIEKNGDTYIYVNGTGDVYYEKHRYDPKHLDYVTLDGVDNVPIYSQYIDFEADMKEIYSPIYNLYRTGNTANIIEATTGEEWTKLNGNGKSYAYDAYLTKEEYLTNFSLPPKVDVNVTIDRGGVSAFEKHYKLSECNTMQDLVNYGNNFFNL